MQIAASKFQLNTHAIGDSANTVILKIYSSFGWNQRPKMEN
jgi:predicted amidohydrolase YtcJ